MQDMINAFKAHLYERASNPFLGTFTFYWLICNYKLVLVLIDGELKAGEKLKLIKTLYPQEVYTIWTGFDLYYYTLLGNGLLIPLIITIAYIFIVPYPIRFIYEFWKTKQKELLEIKQKIDDDTPLTKEQYKKIRQDMINLELEYENSFKRKDEEIYQLKEMIKEKDNLMSNASKKGKKDNEDYNEDVEDLLEDHFGNSYVSLIDKVEAQVLEKVGNSEGIELEQLSHIFKDKIELEYYMDKLIQEKLIDSDTEFEKITITSKGTKSLMNYRKKEEANQIPF